MPRLLAARRFTTEASSVRRLHVNHPKENTMHTPSTQKNLAVTPSFHGQGNSEAKYSETKVFGQGNRSLNSTIMATALVMVLMAMALFVGATAQAGVNLVPSNPPGYSAPLTLYVSNNKIYGAWAVRDSGSSSASAFQAGFYVNGTRVFAATMNNGLYAGGSVYGTDAPFDSYLPNGVSTVELRVNDSRWVVEDNLYDNNYSFTVNVTRGSGSGGSGGGGTTPPLTRAQAAYQWPAFGYSSTSRIISRMTEMYSAQWKPSADFVEWRVTGSTGSYYKGTIYYGLPYSQSNPQVSVTGFLGYLPAMSGTLNSTSSAGVDCSGSISVAWELPSRHTTSTFDGSSSYFTTVVSPGTLVKNASKIQIGDAINSSSWGHVVLVASLPVNGKVAVLEATADQGTNANGAAQRWAVVRNTRSLSDLDANNCRVIRRARLQ